MKKLLLLISIIGITSLQGWSQITLNFSNMTFGPGTVNTRTVDTTGFISPAAGISQTWNYGAVTTTGTGSFTSISPASVNFPTATYADTNLSAPFVPGWYYHYDVYYQHDAAANAILGIEIPMQNYSITAISGGPNDSCFILPQHNDYVAPNNLYLIDYPATMNTAWHATYKDVVNFQLSIASFMLNHAPCQKITHYIRTDTVVGWGSATIPAAGGPSIPYNCLMVKRTSVAIDSFYANGAPAPALMLNAFGLTQGQQTVSNRTFLWRENSNYPLMMISYGANNFTKATSVFVDANVATAGIPDISNNSEISIYPNPATDRVFITGAQNTDVSISDISGRIVFHDQKFNGTSVDLSSLENGNYIVRIISGSNVTIKKLMVL